MPQENSGKYVPHSNDPFFDYLKGQEEKILRSEYEFQQFTFVQNIEFLNRHFFNNFQEQPIDSILAITDPDDKVRAQVSFVFFQINRNFKKIEELFRSDVLWPRNKPLIISILKSEKFIKKEAQSIFKGIGLIKQYKARSDINEQSMIFISKIILAVEALYKMSLITLATAQKNLISITN